MDEVFYLPVHTALPPTGITAISLGAPLFCILWPWVAHGSVTQSELVLRTAVLHGGTGVAKDETVSPQRVSVTSSFRCPPCLSPESASSSTTSTFEFALLHLLLPANYLFHESCDLVFPPFRSLEEMFQNVLPQKRAGISHPTSPSSFAPCLPCRSHCTAARTLGHLVML